MNVMMETQRCICLNKDEFTVLLSAVGIRKLVCFEGIDTESMMQKEYNKAVFSLYKMELITTVDDGFSLSKKITGILTVIKNSENAIHIYSRKEDVTDYCIYSYENKCVVATPGTREEEYIKLRIMDRCYLANFLVESDIFPCSRISEKLTSNQQMLEPVFPEIHELMRQGDQITSEMLKDNPKVETMMILHSEDGAEKEFAAVIWQPIQNKWMTCHLHQIEWKAYSYSAIEKQLDDWMEVAK